ncbi:MAG TPA: hypothetical protein VHZ73_08225 [Vicinamibacterales bacterium]|nr:hypothetical protein [Vicinamibacterales bacterium]
MKKLLFAGFLALVPSLTFAQTTSATDAGLATPSGHELSVGAGHYVYTEPGSQSISIHGTKIEGDYTGTFSLNAGQHWFGQVNVRASSGSVTYDGWCYPYLLEPNSSSPNGYELDLGDASTCSETGDSDWYVEGRALTGKDFVGEKWAWSPATGLGLRHLSNGTTGVNGYRTDNYLYLPLMLTARTQTASHRVVSVTFEYDRLLHGWQTTRDSELGGGDVPATPTAPAFTLNGFTDVSFSQSGGWAIRASAKYQVAAHVSIEPYFIHWSVSASPTNDETATFTVKGITAQEVLGAYEPDNRTNELGVRLGFHF